MGERSDQIERHIEETRGELRGDVHELEEKMRKAADWRAHFRRRPVPFIMGAFATGALISLMARRSRKSASGEEAARSAAYLKEREQTVKQESRKSYEMLKNIKGALVGVAAVSLRKFLEEAVPGFRDEYRHTAEHRSRRWRDRPAERPVEAEESLDDRYGAGTYDRVAGF